MHLQRLEINGFKSFSDRSELAFDRGVTAIVGPNGCGKSNVADAITWVMGEQSAKSLRGERMEDVIFSGSDARKPTATAEVRLRFSGFVKSVSGPAFEAQEGSEATIELQAPALSEHQRVEGRGNGNGHHPANGNGNGHGNGHGSTTMDEIIRSVAREIEVTRRLYRSGESEYLIDGRVCRLRDVHDLLMDTGLGAKAYAIIEQGKIGMILSSRPTDRRQLLEEAAGITKYKARRRAAELKLEAAKQNLTRVDDIVFEVEKQRGTLKRQAAKARRYQRLRDELRRWEKVLFARKYRQLAETIESARARLTAARERESLSAARVSEIDADLGRLRIELVEAETRATSAREAAHARELSINRQQQQIQFDREQVQKLGVRITSLAAESAAIDSRREPARVALASRRAAAADAEAERERAAATLAAEAEAHEAAHREIEGLEADVEASRSEVFSAINSATALRHALEHAAAARDRVAETLTKLDVEAADVRIESERVAAERTAIGEGLRRANDVVESTRIARTARESELASARIELEWRVQSVRAREQELAGLEARLLSLEELAAARAAYSDAARTVLVQANGRVNQQGAIADYLEVDTGYERAVEAYLGDLLQHVVVERPEHAEAGFQLVREANAGRCGFLIAAEEGLAKTAHPVLHEAASAPESYEVFGFTRMPDQYEEFGSGGTRDPYGASGFNRTMPDGVVTLSSVIRVNGPFAPAIRSAIGEAWIAQTYSAAAAASGTTTIPVATVEGDVFHGPRLVSGGTRADARGILETKREIKELRDRITRDRQSLARLGLEVGEFEATIAHASNAIAALNSELHRQDKVIVAHDAQLQHSNDEQVRLDQKREQLVRERRQAEEERDALDRRQVEARESIARLEEEQRRADERFTGAQRRLFEARDAMDELNRRAADAGAAHAALVERAAALAAEAHRLEEAAIELEQRAEALAAELEHSRQTAASLEQAIVEGERKLDADVLELESLVRDVAAADELVTELRAKTDTADVSIKEARAALDAIRAMVADLDVARATAEADLSHLAHTCEDAVNATLDEVAAEVAQMEQDGNAVPDAAAIEAADAADAAEEEEGGVVAEDAAVVAAQQRTLSAEDAIGTLRSKIDRLGPVNMMAIEQFDELETRHRFLSTERADLVASIAQTTEAIARIDQTTLQRFKEAFTAINANFQETFSTLFGGGRAGLTLIDENDPLESGIEIIAQPPGKRLQSVQLLSGGEKALTAIALMFGMFKFKPSPFCVLDEIDAPLDDANIGRFVEMLRSMQQHTQFIVITHNRKTMEIADRLYGVTMEEPGVSKLISVQLN